MLYIHQNVHLNLQDVSNVYLIVQDLSDVYLNVHDVGVSPGIDPGYSHLPKSEK